MKRCLISTLIILVMLTSCVSEDSYPDTDTPRAKEELKQELPEVNRETEKGLVDVSHLLLKREIQFATFDPYEGSHITITNKLYSQTIYINID